MHHSTWPQCVPASAHTAAAPSAQRGNITCHAPAHVSGRRPTPTRHQLALAAGPGAAKGRPPSARRRGRQRRWRRRRLQPKPRPAAGALPLSLSCLQDVCGGERRPARRRRVSQGRAASRNKIRRCGGRRRCPTCLRSWVWSPEARNGRLGRRPHEARCRLPRPAACRSPPLSPLIHTCVLTLLYMLYSAAATCTAQQHGGWAHNSRPAGSRRPPSVHLLRFRQLAARHQVQHQLPPVAVCLLHNNPGARGKGWGRAGGMSGAVGRWWQQAGRGEAAGWAVMVQVLRLQAARRSPAISQAAHLTAHLSNTV